MASDNTQTFNIAWKLHTLGFSIIPSGGGELHKAPLVPWAEFQKRQPTDDEMQDWQERLKPRLWGIVTGARSGVVVLDHDKSGAELEAELGPSYVITPRGGGHWYLQHPGHPVKTVAGVLPDVDIRADGGFCNIVGTRPDGEYKIIILPAPDNLLPWAKFPERIRAAMNGSKPSAEAISEVIPDGQRNATLASLAGTMRRRGMPQAAIEAALLEVNRLQCKPPKPESEVRGIAASIAKYPPGNNIYPSINTEYTCMYECDTPHSVAKRDTSVTDYVTKHGQTPGAYPAGEKLSQQILAWVKDTTGWWSTDELDRDLGITYKTLKDNRRQILGRLREQDTIEPHPKINKQWRYVNTRVTSLAFKTASTAGVLCVKWPLGIDKYANLFPGNLVVVAGSPNAGKTALLLNCIYLNQEDFPIYYLCSEMGAVELRNRLEQFPGMAIEDWKFEAIERAGDFADVIVPDCINIVDYLEMTKELYEVNTHLTAISHKIGSGLAIVALQKKVNAQYGRGQEFSLEKPKLYLSLDRGILRIVKAKSWAQKNVDPCGLEVSFKIIGGCQFEITKDWDWKR